VEINQADEKLRRLYKMVEDGVTDLDDVLGDRLTALKSERERAKAALERIKVQSAPQIELEPDQIERFGSFMRERITEGETPFRKAYLRSIVDAIEVDDKVIRIHGSKASLEQAVIAGEQIGKSVRSFVRKWRTRRDSNPWPLPSEGKKLVPRRFRTFPAPCRASGKLRLRNASSATEIYRTNFTAS
jgi:site-specific DNA recombinase